MANETNEIVLTGLKGNHPLGALAAFGLLRCCTEIAELQQARLHWRQEYDWVAVLTLVNQVSIDDLISLLVRQLPGSAERLEFRWADKISTQPEHFIQAAREAVSAATPRDSLSADFFAAFGSELKKSSTGKIRPTLFDMTSANQGIPKNLREIAQALETQPPVLRGKPDSGKGTSVNNVAEATASFREALIGPWKYKDPEHSLGWDPAMERLYALRAGDPAKQSNAKNRCVKAAVWLAAEALPLFTCAVAGSRLITRGFNEESAKKAGKQRNDPYFSWPIWEFPLPIQVVRSLLALKALTLKKLPRTELRARGVIEVYRSYRVETGGRDNSFKIFRAAQPCLEGGTNANS